MAYSETVIRIAGRGRKRANVRYNPRHGEPQDIYVGPRELEVLRFLQGNPRSTKYDAARRDLALGFALQRCVCQLRAKGFDIVSTAGTARLPDGRTVNRLARYLLEGSIAPLTARDRLIA